MSVVDGLLEGFSVAAQPENLLFVLLGVVVGMVVGVLPGLGPTASIAILLPVTFSLDAPTAVIMLAGIYYGSMYGGTITSVLLNLPGEAASVVTTLDGYQMARQGRAGPALGIAAIGSFVGGVAATVVLVAATAPLASLAAGFGPPELAAVGVLGLVLVTVLAKGSIWKALVMVGAGLLLSTVGQDPVAGTPRFTFGTVELLSGIDFVALAMGLFGIGEVLYNLRSTEQGTLIQRKVRNVWPSRDDLRRSRGPIARGTLLGSLAGLIPGAGGTLSSMMSYGLEKRRAADPSRFGRGAIEGVAGPETANNAGSTTSFVPLLTIGMPANSVMALMFGALLLHGITPGPELVAEYPEVFWGVIASMFLGNIVLLVLNLPMVGVFVQLLRVRAGILGAITVLITMVGVYAVNSRPFDLVLVLGAGVLGYLMRKAGFEPGPLVLAFILGGVIDEAFRKSLLMSNGDPVIFVARPVAAVIVGVAAALLIGQFFRARRRRATRPAEDARQAEPEAVDTAR